MSDQDQQFQYRRENRRVENDLDSISDDHHSRPTSASNLKLRKHKLATSVLPAEGSAQKTMLSPTSHPRRENGNHSSLIEVPNRKLNQPGKMHERKARARKTKRTTSNHEPSSDAALLDLRLHMEYLVKEIKTTREGLITWMDNKMKSSSKDDIISSKPGGTKKGQRQDKKRSKTPRNNPNKGKRTSSTITRNCEDGALGRRFPSSNEEVVVPPKEGENVVVDAVVVEEKEKLKGKKWSSSIKKQKLVGVEADQWTNTASAAAADGYLTLPTVLPQKQAENSKDGTEIDFGKLNPLNSGVNLSSHQLKFDPRALQNDAVIAHNSQQNDAVIARNSLQNLNDYQLINTGSSSAMGNGNGNAFSFPFPLPLQGSNRGIGMRNISTQFGVQYLTQSTVIPGIYRGHPRFSTGNNSFTQSYGALNQHLSFNAQQGGVVMALQRQDVIRGTFNQGIP